jgi:hypothetical protein
MGNGRVRPTILKWFLGAIVIVAVAVIVVIRPAVIWWLVAGAVVGALIFIGSRRGWKAVPAEA